MTKINSLQGSLLRYFNFGNSEEDAKAKVREFSEHMKFFGLNLVDNIDNVMDNRETLYTLISFYDMGFTGNIIDAVTRIKSSNNQTGDGLEPPNKDEFQRQYLEYLTSITGSKDVAIQHLMQLVADMNKLGCPLKENLTGAIIQSHYLNKIYMSSVGKVIDKIYSTVERLT